MAQRDNAESEQTRTTGYDLYIMRHGIAVDRGSPGFSEDAKRPLTPEGKKKMREITAGLVRAGFDLDWIVTSPLVRAAETAEIVGEEMGGRVPRDSCDALGPGGSPEALLTFLAKQPSRRRVMVIGHEPDLSELAARLVGAGRHAHLALKKGGCCLITFVEFPPKSPGQLVWWLTPRLLRKLA
ncbi:MAG: phosphohistidine phosphatase SixA [Acidobacteriia bacterium]|nr:phosphohistidine phosphatase SixA [Terriglobia bacterium]